MSHLTYPQSPVGGYSRDGHSLVYGSFICGGLCGEGWLFLLKQEENSWRVVATEHLWVS